MPATPSAGEASQGFGTRIGPPKSRPLSKKKPHRRSPHACDECRLRKRACDSVDPCGPCRNSGLNCTYHFRRPVPPPTLRIRNLQDHLRLARSWLQEVRQKVPEIPGLDLDKCVRLLDFTLPEDQSQPSTPSAAPRDNASKQAALSNMLAGCDRFVNTSPGVTCFYGAYSELSFILRTLELFQQDEPVSPEMRFLVVSNLFNLPLSPPSQNISQNSEALFPPHDVGLVLSDGLLSKGHPMLCFLSEQLIRDVASRDLSIPGPSLSLLHMVRALGYLLDTARHREEGCRSNLQHATDHFHTGLAMLRPVEVTDVTSLQAVLCAIVFLLSTSRMASAHSLIGTACSAALRLGLHSHAGGPHSNTATERTSRIRLLATVMRLDLFTSLILDLPPFLHRDVVPLTHIARLASEAEAEKDLLTAAALRQVCLLAIPLSKRVYGYSNPAYVDARHFEDVQNEFHCWKVEASSLLACLGQSREHRTMKHDLEMTYNLGHIILFRPFLHYLRTMADGGSIPVTQSYPSLACIKLASSTIVQVHEEMWRDGGRAGPFLAGLWPSVHTVFLCVMCLIFLIAAHHGTSRPSKAWQRAAMGIRILAAFRCADDCATSCIEVLKMVMAELSHTVYFDFDEIERSVVSNCVRSAVGTPAGVPTSPTTVGNHQADAPRRSARGLSHVLDPGASSFGATAAGGAQAEVEDGADRMLVQAEELSTEFDFHDALHLSEEE